jgi:phosphoglycerate dehydrogenase-like enzyme
MIMRERTPFPRSLFEKLPNLEHLISSGMRNLSVDVDAAGDNGVICTGTPSLGYPTAELTWGLIHSLARHVPFEDRETRAGGWQKTVGVGLRDKVLGVMGLGRIGVDVARVGIATGMQVIAWSENLTQDKCDEVGARLVTKEELLEQSDFLTIHLLLSDRTRGLIQTDDLARMKPSAFIINTSRGPIIDEPALINALQNRKIGGAGIDVFEVEPLPLDHPLRDMPNMVIMPHLGYVTVENYQNWYGGTVENVRSWLDGKTINQMSGRNPTTPG